MHITVIYAIVGSWTLFSPAVRLFPIVSANMFYQTSNLQRSKWCRQLDLCVKNICLLNNQSVKGQMNACSFCRTAKRLKALHV